MSFNTITEIFKNRVDKIEPCRSSQYNDHGVELKLFGITFLKWPFMYE